MIHILLGEDSKNINSYIKEVIKEGDLLRFPSENINKELIMSYSKNINLFNELPSIIIENILSDEEIIFSDEELDSLKDSKTNFFLKEDKLLALSQKKYKKYGHIKIFETHPNYKKIIMRSNLIFSVLLTLFLIGTRLQPGFYIGMGLIHFWIRRLYQGFCFGK